MTRCTSGCDLHQSLRRYWRLVTISASLLDLSTVAAPLDSSDDDDGRPEPGGKLAPASRWFMTVPPINWLPLTTDGM